MLCFLWSVPSLLPKTQILPFVLKSREESTTEHLVEKPILLSFVNLCTTFGARL